MSASPMTPESFAGQADLVADELRGYRRFRLGPDGLYPLAVQGGRWQRLQVARCLSVAAHRAPYRGCRCGIYGWYDPDSRATGPGLGTVPAVIAASGRVVMGDAGFRAARARIVAVALPTGLLPLARRRTRRTTSAGWASGCVRRGPGCPPSGCWR